MPERTDKNYALDSSTHTSYIKQKDSVREIFRRVGVKNVLVRIINLVLNSSDAKATGVKPSTNVTTKLNGNQPIQIVQWDCRSLRSCDRIINF
jgi:hypothetical protein